MKEKCGLGSDSFCRALDMQIPLQYISGMFLSISVKKKSCAVIVLTFYLLYNIAAKPEKATSKKELSECLWSESESLVSA